MLSIFSGIIALLTAFQRGFLEASAFMSSLFLLSSDFFTGSGHIKVHASTLDGLIFAKIPLDFVRKGGLDTWEFVLDLVNMLVDPAPHAGVILKDSDGVSVDLSDSPTEGHYIYVHDGKLL